MATPRTSSRRRTMDEKTLCAPSEADSVKVLHIITDGSRFKGETILNLRGVQTALTGDQ
jgi:hypothetical protein